MSKVEVEQKKFAKGKRYFEKVERCIKAPPFF
jgi:hypothetical protein